MSSLCAVPNEVETHIKGEFCSKYNEIYSSPTIIFDTTESNIMVGELYISLYLEQSSPLVNLLKSERARISLIHPVPPPLNVSTKQSHKSACLNFSSQIE